ncbi:AraC family transcriptional regulator [Radiobacillus sp. PE A8.2]|uniref:AraC family transcriptional regulator n=1 Tax=Radiobacillus sp. PE A8.2 TaxID=3380349 RepID=UPI00388FEB3C
MGDKGLQTALVDDRHPRVVAYYFKEWHGFQMGFHSHDAIEIMYVISGQCIVEVEDTVFHMRKGQYIFIDSEVPHRLFVDNTQSCRMLNLEFVLTQTSRTFPSIKHLATENESIKEFFKHNQLFILLKDVNGVYNTLKSLVMELDDSNADNYLMIHILLSQLFLQIARNAKDAKSKTPQQTDLNVKKIVNHLHQNYDYDIKMKDLATLTHLHPSYLHKIFKEAMNCSVVEYLTKVRMEKAKMLLSQTDISVTSVSDYIGLNSSQYFSKVFKKYTGVSPIEYRKKAIDHIRT